MESKRPIQNRCGKLGARFSHHFIVNADLEAAARISGGAVHPSSAVGKRDVSRRIDSDEAAISRL